MSGCHIVAGCTPPALRPPHAHRQLVAWSAARPEPAALLDARAGPRALAVSGAHQHFLAIVAGGRPGPAAAALPAPGGQAAALRGPGAYTVPAHVRHLPRHCSFFSHGVSTSLSLLDGR
jgi:hypothetical protein